MARRWFWWALVLTASVLLIGGSALPANQARLRTLGMTTAGWSFDLVGWEIDAVGEKIDAFFAQPASSLTADQGADLVRAYLARAGEMQQIEAAINRVVSGNSDAGDDPEVATLQTQLAEKRAEQQSIRQTVEQVIQGQVGRELVAADFAVFGRAAPPVQFTFTEPPKKMVVSPRDRIETVYTRMLAPEIDLEAIEHSEQTIAYEHGLSGYITNIGGLGAFPTMVIDRASLPWVLSTVAHEWVHNYLVFFPLGWNYFSSGEMSTINETVAEIVGNEIGERALIAHYPEFAPPEDPSQAPNDEAQTAPETRPSWPPLDGAWPENPLAPPPQEPPRFDFRTEMRQTRLEVDRSWRRAMWRRPRRTWNSVGSSSSNRATICVCSTRPTLRFTVAMAPARPH
ncbi:MAG: hypothetical protein HC802_09540, partial [Caldilineaceae bacterium]|nr:hypothetical protein [Caldilineaceae bacterium]